MLVDRDPRSVVETRERIAAEGFEAKVSIADVTIGEDCRRIAAECVAAFGRIDVLHNNVGIGNLKGPVELPEAEWDQVMATNLKSMYLTCKHVLPQMVAQKSGSIVNISTLGAIRFPPYPMLAYSVSKSGVNALTQSIAMQYADKGIRANALLPGLIDTPMATTIAPEIGLGKEDFRWARARTVPMKRLGEAWDVAYAALFLASDESKYITGVVLPVDGGLAIKA
jgi:NAD(P)-dependent dehydrogenase (short-subunit alcohol dehydrogenase family)